MSEHIHRHVLAIGHSDRGEAAQMQLLSHKPLATQRERGREREREGEGEGEGEGVGERERERERLS